MSNEEAKKYVDALINIYSDPRHRDVAYGEWSEKYLRNQFAFLGIRTPQRRKLTRAFIKDFGLPEKEHLREVIFALWELPQREYQKAALDMLEKVKKTLTPSDMPWVTSLIVDKSWWDTVDALAPSIVGHLFQTYPELIPQYADQWIVDDNFWLQRSALLYQLKYKEKTDEERLFRYILHRADSEEFFVQKAIGWVLREYAKTNPEAVKAFVSQNELKPLSKREALKHL